jgi:hypothetical protein
MHIRRIPIAVPREVRLESAFFFYLQSHQVKKKKVMRVWVKLPMHIRRIPIAVPRECVYILKDKQHFKKHATNKLENDSTRQVGDRCGRSLSY